MQQKQARPNFSKIDQPFGKVGRCLRLFDKNKFAQQTWARLAKKGINTRGHKKTTSAFFGGEVRAIKSKSLCLLSAQFFATKLWPFRPWCKNGKAFQRSRLADFVLVRLNFHLCEFLRGQWRPDANPSKKGNASSFKGCRFKSR